MSDQTRPQRRGDRWKKADEEKPDAPSGYRSTRRSGKSTKKARQAESVGRVQAALAGLVQRVGRGMAYLVVGAVAVLLVVGLAFLAVTGINAYARWSAKRTAEAAQEAAVAAARERSRENLLVIAVQGSQATGFLAMRVDGKNGRVLGVAIPDGAFMEVPGQGFERVGDSYKAGPDVSMSTVSNYLGVPFEYYVVVDDAVYKSMLKQQAVADLPGAIKATNLSNPMRTGLTAALKAVQGKNVGLAPLPVRTVTIGDVTYYEPQRDQIADLLLSWWGVKPGSGLKTPRAIVYNGEGVPGIAGVAARQLIKAGFRVVDTGNADRFDYAKTQIVLLRGDPQEAVRIRDILGVGEIVRKATDEDITDLVVIIGKDYKPQS